MLTLGVDPNAVLSDGIQSHGTVALHHAVWSRSLEAVKVLVEAGAELNRRDSLYGGTPLGWARHGGHAHKETPQARQYAEIAAYLRDKGAEE